MIPVPGQARSKLNLGGGGVTNGELELAPSNPMAPPKVNTPEHSDGDGPVTMSNCKWPCAQAGRKGTDGPRPPPFQQYFNRPSSPRAPPR